MATGDELEDVLYQRLHLTKVPTTEPEFVAVPKTTPYGNRDQTPSRLRQPKVTRIRYNPLCIRYALERTL